MRLGGEASTGAVRLSPALLTQIFQLTLPRQTSPYRVPLHLRVIAFYVLIYGSARLVHFQRVHQA